MQSNRLPNSRRLLMSGMAALLDLIPGPRTVDVVSFSIMEAPGPTYFFGFSGGDSRGCDAAPRETNAADEDIFFLATWSYRKGEPIAGSAVPFDLTRWVCPVPRSPLRR
jgi:hypothetical protein